MLPEGVTESQLAAAVVASRSWRGVLRHLGMTSSRAGRQLRSACDALGISYQHFSGMHGTNDAAFRDAVAQAGSWQEAFSALGYAAESGSARASIRRRAAALGSDTSHLDRGATVTESGCAPFRGDAEARHLRRAAASLVAAKCALLGYYVSWPLEPAPYDLVVDTRPGGLLRVQVKSGTRRVNGAWMAWISRSSKAPEARGARRSYSAEEVDYFGIVDGDQGVYMIPVAAVEGRTALSLRAYEAYRLTT